MEHDLKSTLAWELDQFIEDRILADTRFLNKVRADIDYICAFLKKRCFRGATHDVKVSRVVMSGSFDSDTDLKDTAEVNITVFLKGLNCYKAVYKRQGEFLKEIKKQLCKLPGEKKFQLHYEVQNPEEPSPMFLSFKLSSPELQQEVECRVRLARKVLDEPRKNKQLDIKLYNEIYSELIHECITPDPEDVVDSDWNGDFALSFTELRQDFLRYRPPKLRKLICLVKYWHQLCMEQLGKPVPPRYALELLTVYAWEHGSGDADFNIAQGFRTVLKLITKYEYLIIYWTVYYDFRHREVSDYLYTQLQKDRPIILDPADPTRNIAGCSIMGWCFMASVAKAWLDDPCFRNMDGSQVRSWVVPVRPCIIIIPGCWSEI
uniref:2'-5'-oligoadenylate synthetase 1 domain-containing protein n=1 Tax=Mus spicilegus TaxID=10103 RepID=A0A8C6IF97_MUSSI